jgi:hypothetical protein
MTELSEKARARRDEDCEGPMSDTYLARVRGWNMGYTYARSEMIEFIKNHREAYSLELFPNSAAIKTTSTHSDVAARVTRHTCDVILKELGLSGEG